MGHYLVTGAAGFIGAAVTTHLLDAHHRVVGLDNFSAAYDVRLKAWRLDQLLRRDGFTFQQLDITDRVALEALFQQQGTPFDGVINLAAWAGVRPSVLNPWVYIETNVTGALNLLEACRRAGVPKFVLASTSSLYGEQECVPFRETTSSDKPLSPYAASKKAAETLCYTYHYLHGIDVTVLRYFTVYGPAGRPDMMPFRFVQWIREGRPLRLFGDGLQSRDFTYVDDIARGTVAGLKTLGYEIINLGSGRPIVVRDAIAEMERLIGRPATLLHSELYRADTRTTWADIQKAEQLLGWRPHVPFSEGVQRLVDWYESNRAWTSAIRTE